MEIAAIEEIDWSAPWLKSIAELGRAISTSRDWRSNLNKAAEARDICNWRGRRITFALDNAAGDEPYEAFIARTGSVPTRANLHDFFNALAWLQFPKSKSQLNRLQSAAIERIGVGTTRGPLRDALTLLDENAVLLLTRRADIVESLRVHDWTTLFHRERAAWHSDVTVVAFGHALLEKLVRPYRAITAHALHVALAPGTTIDRMDWHMAAALGDHLSPHDLLPLPVLGIPGWCAQNEDPSFYLDAAVFRPAKMRRQSIVEKQSNETRRS